MNQDDRSLTVEFKTPWFELVSESHPSSGHPFYFIRTDDYVINVATTKNGDFLLVNQYRSTTGTHTWECPSGHVDPGETPIEAARRELVEETGHDAGSIVPLGGLLNPDPGRLGNRMWCFHAKDVFKVEELDGNHPEGIKCSVRSPAELAAMIRSGEFNHAFNLLPLYQGMLEGRFQLPLNGKDGYDRANPGPLKS